MPLLFCLAGESFCLARRTEINMTAQLRAYVDFWRSGGAAHKRRLALKLACLHYYASRG